MSANDQTPVGDYFSGVFRMTYELQNADGVSEYFLETNWPGCPAPLTFHTRDGYQIRPFTNMSGYDQGSVPQWAQSAVSPCATGRAFAMHDMSFINHGWMESHDNGVTWQYAPQSQQSTNDMLARWMMADGDGWKTADVAAESCDLGGSEMWDSHTGPFPVSPFVP